MIRNIDMFRAQRAAESAVAWSAENSVAAKSRTTAKILRFGAKLLAESGK